MITYRDVGAAYGRRCPDKQHRSEEHGDLQPKPDDVYRIVMLGDLLTFGWGVEEEQTSSRRLERKLNSVRSNGKRVSIMTWC